MNQIKYRIVPGVTPTGEPTWILYRDYANPFGVGSIELARNPNRDVLDKAIAHLTSASEEASR